MTFAKGHILSAEARAKLSASKTGKKLGPMSAEHRAKIGAARKGKQLPAKHERTCPCGKAFSTAAHNARFCSRQCNRAARGHGLRHAPEFLCFPQLCAICGSMQELVGDHDHSSGRPRGILCRKCNLALGNMEDSPERLRAAAAYLEVER
jgi:hypothetical protein